VTELLSPCLGTPVSAGLAVPSSHFLQGASAPSCAADPGAAADI